MNYGAFLFRDEFLGENEIAEAAALARTHKHEMISVHREGKYADLQWFQVDLDPDWPFVRKILTELGAECPELLVFYFLEPGAKLHPHRDLTGASLNVDRVL